jgi:hypothetical protein
MKSDGAPATASDMYVCFARIATDDAEPPDDPGTGLPNPRDKEVEPDEAEPDPMGKSENQDQNFQYSNKDPEEGLTQQLITLGIRDDETTDDPDEPNEWYSSFEDDPESDPGRIYQLRSTNGSDLEVDIIDRIAGLTIEDNPGPHNHAERTRGPAEGCPGEQPKRSPRGEQGAPRDTGEPANRSQDPTEGDTTIKNKEPTSRVRSGHVTNEGTGRTITNRVPEEPVTEVKQSVNTLGSSEHAELRSSFLPKTEVSIIKNSGPDVPNNNGRNQIPLIVPYDGNITVPSIQELARENYQPKIWSGIGSSPHGNIEIIEDIPSETTEKDVDAALSLLEIQYCGRPPNVPTGVLAANKIFPYAFDYERHEKHFRAYGTTLVTEDADTGYMLITLGELA